MVPVHLLSVRAPELAKYEQLWADVPEYRETSPGEGLVGLCVQVTGLQPGMRLVDVGCGTGRAGAAFAQLGLRVTLVDGSGLAVDADYLDRIPFVQACLWDDWPQGLPPYDVAFCADVLEHMPEAFSMLVVSRCLAAAPQVLLLIALRPDAFGAVIEQTLHVNVQSFVWWRDHLGELGTVIEARDLSGHGLFLLRRPS